MNRAGVVKIKWWAVAAAAMVVSCSLDSDDIAGKGTGSETPNTLTGIIQDSSGLPVEGALVNLNPSHFNPVRETLPDSLRTTTDDKGGYQFKVRGKNSYNIVAYDPSRSNSSIIWDIRTFKTGDSLVELDTASLQAPGSIVIPIVQNEVSEGGYIYIPGTEFSVKVLSADLEAGFAELSGVPSSVYSNISYTNSDFSDNINIAPMGIRIFPGETVIKGPYYAWKNQVEVFINTPSGGAGVTQNILDFPLLLRLDSTSLLFDGSRSDGGDLRFSKSDGFTPLAYELEYWDNINKNAAVWVKLDTLYGSSSGQNIIAYSGAAEVAGESSGMAVFDSSLGYIGVWHLEPDFSGDISRLNNSAYNGNHGTFVDLDQNVLTGASALISRGIDFNGNSQFISTSRYFDSPMEFAISLWFNTSSNSGGKLVEFNNYSLGKTNKDRHIWMGDSGKLYFGVFPPPPDVTAPEDSGLVTEYGAFRTIGSSESYNDGNWHYVVACLSAEGMRLYVDGEKVAENREVTEAQHFKGIWQMGYGLTDFWDPLPGSSYFQGLMDEVRIFYGNVSEAKIKLEFENQNPSSQMVNVKGTD